MIEFRQKKFSILSDTINGASIGGTAGLIGSLFRKKTDPQQYSIDDHKHRGEVYNATLKTSAAGLIIGAALGALVGGIKEISNRINRKNTVDHRLMYKVVEVLKKDNLKEGIDFTKDPKTATQLKTKVCIVISKNSGELRLSVNLVSDPKLKTVSDEIVKRLPNSSAVTEKVSDKFNDISITSISDNSVDVGLIVGIIEKFIHSGYPVYLVEVG